MVMGARVSRLTRFMQATLHLSCQMLSSRYLKQVLSLILLVQCGPVLLCILELNRLYRSRWQNGSEDNLLRC